jgi:hypothetical protein
MVGAGVTSLAKLEGAVRDFHRDHEPYDDDPKRLRAAIDALELEFSSMVRRVQQRGDHLVGGNISAASWIGQICGMSIPLRPIGSVSASSWSRCPWLPKHSPEGISATSRRR